MPGWLVSQQGKSCSIPALFICRIPLNGGNICLHHLQSELITGSLPRIYFYWKYFPQAKEAYLYKDIGCEGRNEMNTHAELYVGSIPVEDWTTSFFSSIYSFSFGT